MRVLAVELVTAGGLGGAPGSDALLAEGEAMLMALVRDLAAVPGVQVGYLRDARLPPLSLPARRRLVQAPHRFRSTWRTALRSCDAVWPIAPESEGRLESLCQEVLAQGLRLFNSRPDAVRLCASKYLTARHLAAHGIRAVPTLLLRDCPAMPAWGTSVVKPDDGAGCDGIRVVYSAAELAAVRAVLPGGRRWVVQPYVCGMPASLSLLCCQGSAQLLACNVQRIARAAGRFTLQGIAVNALGGDRAPYADLAARIAAALPGLWGYVGVDLIVDGQAVWVLEVNPRLTSSYVGLREALDANPAALVLGLPADEPMQVAPTGESPGPAARMSERVAEP